MCLLFVSHQHLSQAWRIYPSNECLSLEVKARVQTSWEVPASGLGCWLRHLVKAMSRQSTVLAPGPFRCHGVSTKRSKKPIHDKQVHWAMGINVIMVTFEYSLCNRIALYFTTFFNSIQFYGKKHGIRIDLITNLITKCMSHCST